MNATSIFVRATWMPTLLGAGALAVLSGCQVAPTVPPRAASLELIDFRPLALAQGCEAAGGSVFVEFTVLADGRTDNIQTPAAPACVQEALRAWIGSLRYVPPASATDTGIEWLLVTARRGS
jgi:hypothetical protein